jgi:hypothetical protein
MPAQHWTSSHRSIEAADGRTPPMPYSKERFGYNAGPCSLPDGFVNPQYTALRDSPTA